MGHPRVLRSGIYTNGGPSLISAWTLGTGAVNGVMGRSPMQFIGWYDLRPWQDTPEGPGRGLYDRNVVALESGEGRVRFSLPWDGTATNGSALNPIAVRTAGPLANIVTGSRDFTDTAIWQPMDNANRNITPQAVSLMVAAVDSAEQIMEWSTSVPQQWDAFDATNTDTNARYLFQNAWSVGPEIISELAHGGASTFDLEELGGGARFVGLFLTGYWLGPAIDATQTGARIKWQVEDCKAKARKGSITFAFPVRAVQEESAAGALADADPLYTVAQWSLQRFGGIDLCGGLQGGGGAAGAEIASPGCSVIYANGGLAVDTRIDYHVGTCPDFSASATLFVQAVAAATANGPAVVRLDWRNDRTAKIQPPYSYADLVAYTQNGAAPPDGVSNPAIVYVCVG